MFVFMVPSQSRWAGARGTLFEAAAPAQYRRRHLSDT